MTAVVAWFALGVSVGFALPPDQLEKDARHSGYNVDTEKILPSRLDPGDRIRLQIEWARVEKWLERTGTSSDTRLRPYAVIAGRMTYGKPLRVGEVRHDLETWRLEREPPDDHPERRRMIG
jgi:hypothetical protein